MAVRTVIAGHYGKTKLDIRGDLCNVANGIVKSCASGLVAVVIV